MKLRTIGLALAVALTTSAAAQVSEPTDFDVQRFRTPGDAEGLLDLEWGRLPQKGAWSLGAFLHYANDPLALYRDQTDGWRRTGKLVSDRLDLDLMGTYVATEWLELGLATRITLYQTRPEEQTGIDPGLENLSPVGLGDLVLTPKLAILRQADHGVDLSFLAAISLPSSFGRNYFGEPTLSLTPELAVSRSFGALRTGANLAYLLRGRTEILGLAVDDELQFRVGAGYDLMELTEQPIEVGLAFSGATAAQKPFGDATRTPWELLLGAHYDLPSAPVRLYLGGGRGLTIGYGSPDWRLFAGVRYLGGLDDDRDDDGVKNADDACPDKAGPPENKGCPDKDTDDDGLVDRLDECPNRPGPGSNKGCPLPDTDGDGIIDDNDECPEEPGPEERNGCPERDTDGDGILDEADKCWEEPGPAENGGCPDVDTDGDGLVDRLDKCPDVAGPKDNEGCPDVDTDGDGIKDRFDKCREQAEDIDEFEDEDGCPDLDNDGDGIVDTSDNCPIEPGIPENRGCPDKDTDGDGIVDRLDNCPTEAGVPENQGCKKKQLVIIKQEKLEILDMVYFQTAKAVIQKRSYPLLDNVAEVLNAHPEIEKVRVEGHTDSQGKDAYNKKLSQRRADAVRAYLMRKKVDGKRLIAVGFGEERPVAPNDTDEGRAANRRVEFNLVYDE